MTSGSEFGWSSCEPHHLLLSLTENLLLMHKVHVDKYHDKYCYFNARRRKFCPFSHGNRSLTNIAQNERQRSKFAADNALWYELQILIQNPACVYSKGANATVFTLIGIFDTLCKYYRPLFAAVKWPDVNS